MKSQLANQKGSDLSSGLAQPAQRALARAGYTHLKQLTKVSEDEVKQLHGIGSNGLAQLQRALAEKGMAFADRRQKHHKDK